MVSLQNHLRHVTCTKTQQVTELRKKFLTNNPAPAKLSRTQKAERNVSAAGKKAREITQALEDAIKAEDEAVLKSVISQVHCQNVRANQKGGGGQGGTRYASALGTCQNCVSCFLRPKKPASRRASSTKRRPCWSPCQRRRSCRLRCGARTQLPWSRRSSRRK